MKTLVLYDISDDRRRDRVAKVLRSVGVRLQFSVFECVLRSDGEFNRLTSIVRSLVDAEQDRVRIYRFDEGQRRSPMVEIGLPYEAPLPDFWIV